MKFARAFTTLPFITSLFPASSVALPSGRLERRDSDSPLKYDVERPSLRYLLGRCGATLCYSRESLFFTCPATQPVKDCHCKSEGFLNVMWGCMEPHSTGRYCRGYDASFFRKEWKQLCQEAGVSYEEKPRTEAPPTAPATDTKPPPQAPPQTPSATEQGKGNEASTPAGEVKAGGEGPKSDAFDKPQAGDDDTTDNGETDDTDDTDGTEDTDESDEE